MNYKKTYDTIIKRARARILSDDVYSEQHHIMPKCMNGGDEPENLVRLTAKEHFICHALLCYIYPNKSGLFYAFHLMNNGADSTSSHRRYISGSKYEKLKIAHSKIVSEQMIDNNHALGYKHTELAKESMSQSRIGNANASGANSELQNKLISSSLTEYFKTNPSPNLGRVHSPEEIEARRIANQTICPYCKVTITRAAMTMYHGPNPSRIRPEDSGCRINSLSLGSSWSTIELRTQNVN